MEPPRSAMQQVFAEMLGKKSVDSGKSPLPSWTSNLERSGGFWKDSRWCELQLERRMPLALKMFEELVYALPPLPESYKVCDLGGGSGRLSAAILEAYPGVSLTLIEPRKEMVEMALRKMALEIQPIQRPIEIGSVLPGAPYDCIVTGLSIARIIGEDSEGADALTKYDDLFLSIFKSLRPGGHFLIGDDVGKLPLYVQMIALDGAGFHSVDCAWRERDFFVIGGRKPVEEVKQGGTMTEALSNLWSRKTSDTGPPTTKGSAAPK